MVARRTRQALAVAAGLVLASACSILESLDDLRAPAADASTSDAAPFDGASLCDAGGLDLKTDGRNCGRCGHDCLGGGCSGGICLPITLASAQGSPFGIAVDSTTVYWANNELDASFASCPISGCPDGATTLVNHLVLPADVFIRDGRLFMTTYGMPGDGGALGSVTACDPTNCAATRQVLATTPPYNPVAIVANATAVYWTNSNAGTISTCGAQTCGAATTFANDTPNGPWYGLALDGKAVYWTSNPKDAGAVFSCALGGCSSPTRIATSGGSPFDLAIDATNVYWTTEDGGQVLRCPLAGCAGAPTVIASNQALPTGIAVDESGIYWGNRGAGTILHCPIAGCPVAGPTVLAAGQGAPWEVVLDGRSVYWTDSSGGRVVRLAKP